MIMKRIKYIILLFVLLNFIITFPVYSNNSGGSFAASSLLIYPGSSVSASGNSGVALIKPNWQYIRLNPAHLSIINDMSVGFSHNEYMESIQQNSFSIVHNYETYKYYFGVDYIGYGRFDRYYDDDGLPLLDGTFSAYNYTINSYFVLPQIHNLHSGFGIKYFHEKLDTFNGEAIAFDLGLLYLLEEYNFALGLTIQNFGTTIKYHREQEELPLLSRFGLSYSLMDDYFQLFFDIEKIRKQDMNFYLGMQFSFNPFVTLKAGINGANDSSKRLTTGLEINVSDDLQLSYAFLPNEYFDDVHQFSLSYKFGQFKDIPTERHPSLRLRVHKPDDLTDERVDKIKKLPPPQIETPPQEDIIKSLEYYNLAVAYYNKGDYVNSLKTIKEAIVLNRDDFENVVLLLYIYYHLGHYQTIRDITRDFTEYQLDHPKIRILLNSMR